MIAFVTQPAHPAITPDDQLTAALLQDAGHPVQGVPWDAAIDWSRFELVVIRSPWDYHQRPVDFLAWLDHLHLTNVPVHNPAPILRWNSDKRYLLELASKGIPVPATRYARQNQPLDLTRLLDLFGHDQVVIKPTVAAGAIDTWIARRDTLPADQSRLDQLLARSGVLIQPLLPQVATDGEWSLIFFNHAFSHAVLKRPKPHDFRVQEKHGGSTQPLTPPDSLLAQAHHILTAASPADAPLLYARVDGVMIDNTFTLMELEALEPALFLSTSPGAPDRFARAILSHLPR